MVADVNNNGLFDVIAVDASDPTFTPKTLDAGGRFWRNAGDFRFRNITFFGFPGAERPRRFLLANARRTRTGAVDGIGSLNANYEAWYDFFDIQVTPQLLAPILPINAMTAQPGLDPIRPLDLRPYHADVVFADFDNDTWMDFVVLDRREATLLETRAIFYHNQGNGDFEPLPTTLSGLDGTGIAGEAADLNNDGLVDLIIAGDPDNSNDNASLFASPDRYVDKVYMNTGALGAENHWLRLRFSGISHARLIGSRVEIFDTQTGQHLGTRGVYTHHSYKTGSPLQVHFGLGAHDRVDLRVSLPSGERIEADAVQANRFMDFDLGDATLTEIDI